MIYWIQRFNASNVFFLSLIIIPVCFFCTPFSFSQTEYTTKNKKAISAYEKGLKYYENRQNTQAIKEIKKAISADNKFIEPHLLLGTLYFDNSEYRNSIGEYKLAIEINPEYNSKIYFFLAFSEWKDTQYADAAEHFKNFLSKPDINKKLAEEAGKWLKYAEFSALAFANPVPFNPQNMGSRINSALMEYFPTVSVDEQTLIFTRKIHKQESVEQTDEDFFVSEKINNNWTDAVSMGPPINTKHREGAKSLSADGQTLYFTACEKPDGKGSCDLYYSTKIGNRWGPPQNMGFPVNSSKWESQPCISSDGKILYFASNRSGGKGGKDIWKTTQNEDGAWSAPIPFELSTEGNDEVPFIHPDNQTFYFSSDGYPGLGGMDLFVSRKNIDGGFSVPGNLGYPINTAAEEYSIFVSTNGKTAYYASDRKEGSGGLDIYFFELPEEVRPLKVTYAKGIVYDAKTKKPLEAGFELIDLATKQTVAQSYSNAGNGNFLVCLPTNRNYALNVSKAGYLFYSENFSLLTSDSALSAVNDKPFLLDVPLQMIEIGGKVVLKNIFFETGKFDLKEESKAELNKLVALLKSNASMKIEISGHTDNVGKKEANQILSENRAKSVYAYLLLQGITAPRISYKGYGDSEPICPANDTDDCKSQNRRTEFKVTGK